MTKIECRENGSGKVIKSYLGDIIPAVGDMVVLHDDDGTQQYYIVRVRVIFDNLPRFIRIFIEKW